MTAQILEQSTARPTALDAVTQDKVSRSAQLPKIIVTNRELRDITEDALNAVAARNTPPTLFTRGSMLLRFRETDDDAPLLERLGEAVLRGLLTRSANWQRATRTGLMAISPPPRCRQ